MNESSTNKILSKPFGSQSTFEYATKFLDDQDILRMGAVCKAWRQCINNLNRAGDVKGPNSGKDDQHRQKAESCFLQARMLRLPSFEKALHVQDSKRLKLSREEYRKGMAELIEIDPANRTAKDLRAIYDAAGCIAARGTTKPPCCLLCLEDRKLIGSHVIPNSVLVRLTNEVLPSGKIGKNKGSIVSTLAPNRNRAAAKVTWPLFCKPGCEDLFSDNGEDNFADPFWKFIVNAKDARNHAPMLSSRYEGDPGDNSTHYCVASIVFRYMILNGNNDIRPFVKECGSEVQEAYWRLFFLLRSYLLDPENAPSPYIELFASENDLGKKSMINTVFTTFKEGEKRCFTTGHFELAGFHFIVTESAEASQQNDRGKGFCSVIERCQAPDRLVIEIQPHQVLELPEVAIHARELDAKVWQNLLMSRNPKRQTVDGVEGAMMPTHPLADTIMKKSPPAFWSRLSDDLKVVPDPTDGSPNLRFSDPSKHEILGHKQFHSDEQTCDVWLCKHKLSRKDPHTVILHMMDSKGVSMSFGYHLADRLFKQDLRVEAQVVLEQCDEGNCKEIRDFLGLAPLRGTRHELIEGVTKAASTYSVIINALKGWWSHKYSKEQEPRNFVAHPGRNEIHFVEKLLPRDTDCGFYMLGISREEAISVLLENFKNEKIRQRVAHDIFARFISNELPPSLQISSALKARERYQQLAGEMLRVEKQMNSNPSTELLSRHRKLHKDLTHCLNKVRKWTESPGVYYAFVEDFLGTQQQRLTYIPGQSGLLDVIAELTQVYIDIWVPANRDSTGLIHAYGAGDATNHNARRIDAVHTDSLMHFNLLIEQDTKL